MIRALISVLALVALTGAALAQSVHFEEGFTLGSTNTLRVTIPDPTTGHPNALNGGIVSFQAVDDYQVTAIQLHPPPLLAPTWGPVGEWVKHRLPSSRLPDLQRISYTAMADFADPLLTDAAGDYRIQMEVFGNAPRIPLKIVSQQHTGYMVEFTEYSADGNLRVFRRTDAPAPTADNLALILGTDARGTSPPLTAPGTQSSPSLIWQGLGYDTALHKSQWRSFVELSAGDGNSNLVFEARIDGAAWQRHFTITNTGIIPAVNIGLGGHLSLGAGSNHVIAGDNGGIFAATVPANIALMGVADKVPGKAAWKVKGENGFEGWLLAVSGTTANALGTNARFLTLEDDAGNTISVPYWTNVAP